jgi:hypothetical protein
MKEYGNVSQRCLRTCLLFFVSVLAATFEFMTAAVFEAVNVHRGWTKLIKQNYKFTVHPQLA